MIFVASKESYFWTLYFNPSYKMTCDNKKGIRCHFCFEFVQVWLVGLSYELFWQVTNPRLFQLQLLDTWSKCMVWISIKSKAQAGQAVWQRKMYWCTWRVKLKLYSNQIKLIKLLNNLSKAHKLHILLNHHLWQAFKLKIKRRKLLEWKKRWQKRWLNLYQCQHLLFLTI